MVHGPRPHLPMAAILVLIFAVTALSTVAGHGDSGYGNNGGNGYRGDNYGRGGGGGYNRGGNYGNGNYGNNGGGSSSANANAVANSQSNGYGNSRAEATAIAQANSNSNGGGGDYNRGRMMLREGVMLTDGASLWSKIASAFRPQRSAVSEVSTGTTTAQHPDIRMQETGNAYMVMVAVPGFDVNNDVTVEMMANLLIISGRREVPGDCTSTHIVGLCQPGSASSFRHAIALPSDAGEDGVPEVKIAHGLLTVTMNKSRD